MWRLLSRKSSWVGRAALCFAFALALPGHGRTQTETIRFCEVPTILPGNTPLPDYSPALCFEYSGLKREAYTLKVFLLETKDFFCASGLWCGDDSAPPAVFSIDNRDGTKSSGKLVVVRKMDVFDYPSFLWVADLYNQAGGKVAADTQLASPTINRAPVLKPIGSQCIMVGQPLEFVVSASDPEGDAFTLSAQNLPPGATFDGATGRFRWPSPTAGTYPDILFKATQVGAIPLSDAEVITIQIGQSQVLALSSDSYTTGEGGPAVVTVSRTGGTVGTITVNYSTSNVTALAGSDYVATSGTLTFADGEASKVVNVPIVNDTTVEPNETFKVSLSSPTGCGVLGAPSVATVTIVDDDTPSLSGRWGPVVAWPTVPIHMHLLPTGKVLFWDRHNDAKGWDPTPRLWDPETGTFTILPMPDYDVFCGGHTFMADGKLFVTGGHVPMPPAPVDSGYGEDKASIYDLSANTWTRLPKMNAGRWYPSNVTLANGDVLVMSGTTVNTRTVNRLPQVWQTASGAWRDLTGAQLGAFPEWPNFYPFLFLAPNGKVFNAGPQQTSRYLDTSGTGAWSDVAKSSLSYRDYGSSVMYDDGKVLIVGGNPYEPDPLAPPTILPSATAEVINLSDSKPVWRPVPAMTVGRRHLNATLLPDGKVLVTGGSSAPGFDIPSGAIFYAEMWDPATEAWSTLAGYTRYRGYHSNALLLPDGRVLIAGGGHPDPPGGVEQKNVEIHSPPYLFKGTRPTITSAPLQVTYGQTFFIGTPDAASVTNVNWIRLPSVTHAFNQSQRLNRLNFSQEASGLQVTAPPSANLSPPGHYLLFILNSNGVPSVAQIIRINAGPAPGRVANASAASFSRPPLATESIVAAFGSNLATRAEAATTIPLPTTLAGTTVKVRDSAGAERLAPLFLVSPAQINYQLPAGTATGIATVTVISGDGAVSTEAIQVSAVAPGLFSANANGQGVAAGYALRVNNNSQNSESISQFDAAQGRVVAVPINLGSLTDQVFLVLFGTGIRFRSSLSATAAKIGGIDAPVFFAGAQGSFVGLDQVNLLIPRSLAGRGEVEVMAVVDGKPANIVRINVK